MKTVRFFIKPFVSKPLLFILLSILLLTTVLLGVASSQANDLDKEKVVRQVAQKWIQVGMEQYRRGYYKAAEQSFLRAQDYQEYLSAGEREKLSELLKKSHEGAVEKERISETIQAADGLVKQGQIAKAKAHLEQIKDNEFLTEEQKGLVAEGLEKLNSQLKGQDKEISELYGRSVGLYQAGDLEKAREGFIKVAKSGLSIGPEGKKAEDYLVRIDSILAQKAVPSPIIEIEPGEGLPELGVKDVEGELLDAGAKAAEEVKPQVVKEEQKPAVLEVPEPVTEEGSYIQAINRKRNIIRSHTRAVVNDALAKAQNYLNQGEFDKAREAVGTAERTVNKNRLDLGDELLESYSSELGQLTEKIAQGQSQSMQQLQEQKRVEAIEAQRRYREQVEADRSKRIAELMDNAMAYQKQQRYEEALGQLQSLLTIDPMNNQALILKQTLEDTINFRKQLEIQRESERERISALIGTDESMIPYSSDFPTYPKNWREISAKRRPEEAIGRTAADAAVYDQLEQIVNLSELSPEMPFGDAIDVIRNSVEPPLKVFVNWRDLYDNADVDQSTQINMDPISAIPLGRALTLLLQAVSGGFADISYAVQDGVVTIATREAIPSEYETLVYDITDVIGRPADFYAVSGGDVSVGGEGEAGGEQLGEEEELSREELLSEALLRAESLVMLIQQTIEPESWFEAGGEGSVTIYENKKLIIYQTRKVHQQIEGLLEKMRKSLGHQVNIETRFLLVGENFLEDIGLDVDFDYWVGGKLGLLRFRQGSYEAARPLDTEIPGSWAKLVEEEEIALPGMLVTGGYGNLILNDLEVHFLLRATQAHRDAKALTAPKISVLSGESAAIQILRFTRYPYEIEFDIEEIGEFGAYRHTLDYEQGSIVSGTILNVSPTIMHDKKNVLLNITAELREFLGWESYDIQTPALGPDIPVGVYKVLFPENEISRIETRVSIPDGGTLLLGGQKITAEVEREAGVPVLSKVPLVGRLFSNRSKIKDTKILLILVKPTIILQEETEAEAIAAMEGGF